ncbi:Collagen triple helix repeat protein [Methylotenera versatilis 301]|uniref:Collagen triple helix repeat protein n=2 Tax=Methylotenera TaxID=359407 RepID=D7DPY5_METV0|nr:Collagen triple helix repeat protein [Methylotenera versatilis 301]
MNNSILMTALVAALFLSACDKTPVVVNVPAETVVVPGPAGPAGKAGEQGVDGNKGDKGNMGNTGVQGNEGIQGDTGQAGETGKSGDTTVIITPPAEPAPAN